MKIILFLGRRVGFITRFRILEPGEGPNTKANCFICYKMKKAKNSLVVPFISGEHNDRWERCPLIPMDKSTWSSNKLVTK